MFAFSEIDPQRTGRVDHVPVPFFTHFGNKFKAGMEDSITGNVYRLWEDIHVAGGTILQPDEANKKFGIEGILSFKEPIDEDVAALRYGRKQSELNNLALIDFSANRAISTKGIGGFLGSMAGNLLMPLDLATAFVPVVGSSKAASALSTAGKSAFRMRLARGFLATEEGLLEAGIPFPKFTASVIDASVGNAIAEIPVFIQKTRDQAFYGPADSVLNVAAGGLFGGGFRLTIEGLSRALGGASKVISELTPAGRDLAAKKAFNDRLQGDRIDVSEAIALDDNIIRERAKFDEILARKEAIQEADETVSEKEAFRRAELETQGSHGPVNERDIVTIVRQEIQRSDASGNQTQRARILSKLLERAEGGEKSFDLFKNMASLMDLAYDPSVKKFPPFYRLAEPTETQAKVAGARKDLDKAEANAILRRSELELEASRLEGEKTGDLVHDQPLVARQVEITKQIDSLKKQYPDRLSNEDRIAHLEQIKQSKSYQRAREERIQAFVEKKRQEAFDKARRDLIAEQQAEGKLLSDEEINRYRNGPDVDEKDIQAVQTDATTLEAELKDLTAEEKIYIDEIAKEDANALRLITDCIIKNGL